jgi:serine/threonine-protein kinase
MELERITFKMLAKDPAARYQHADEIVVDLKAIRPSLDAGHITVPSGSTDRSSPLILVPEKVIMWGKFALIATLSVLSTFFIVWNLKPGSAPDSKAVMRLTVNLNQGESLGGTNYGNNLAISPDGKQLIYQATADNVTQLYIRLIGSYESSPLPGTEDAEHPIFSPDGMWIAFFQAGMLKKLRIGSASPVPLCKGTPNPHGITWGADGTIIFSATDGSLVRVKDSGGTPLELTKPDSEQNEFSHSFPQVLPGGKSVLFQVSYTEGLKNKRIAVLSLETSRWEIVLDEEGYWPSYAHSGHIVFTQSGILMAVPFDLQHLDISGSPFPVLENVLIPGDKPINFCFSHDGTLLYASPTSEETETELVWVNQQGDITRPREDLTLYSIPRLSVNGKKVLMQKQSILYVYDITSNIMTQLTFKPGITYPVWSPDGELAAFTASWKGQNDTIHSIPIDGTREVDELYTSDNPIYSTSWSPDGLWLAFYEINPATQRDIWILSLEDRKASPIIATQNNERVPMFSPDGRYIAYVSNDTGRDEIFVQPFPTTGAKWQISDDGGREPLWAPDGRSLYYRMGNKVMSVRLGKDPAFTWEKAQMVFEGDFFSHVNYTSYCITPRGDRFLMSKPKGESVIKKINVVLNWFEELERLVPIEK